MKMKKLTATFAAASLAAICAIGCSADGVNDYPWAADAVNYCVQKGILSGNEYGDLMLGNSLTRAQMARILVDGFSLPIATETGFADMSPDNWAYLYAATIEGYMPKKGSYFNPDDYVSREELTSTLVRASGLTEGSVRNPGITSANFADAAQIDGAYKTYIDMAVERAYLVGSDGCIRPKDVISRAEACVLIRKVIEASRGNLTLTWADLGVEKSYTPITGAAQITVEQAQAWARARGADERFINIAPVYWQYGELFGIRPEIMYAQAAKETGFGHYTGAVKPEMNNWAGIKIKDPIGDRTEDHETFATPDDGVRAHYNHMCAYLGLDPIGQPHDRYYVVKSIDWAGTVKYLEELGGKWCPDLYYGYDILRNYIAQMAG